MHDNFDQLCQWRSFSRPRGDLAAGVPSFKQDELKLPPGSPYVGSQRHAPPSPSPILCFSGKREKYVLPPDLRLPGSDLDVDPLDVPSTEMQGTLPEEAWSIILSMTVEVKRITSLSLVARGFQTLLKSEFVWANHSVRIPPGRMAKFAPHLGEWLPAWRWVSKLVIPRSVQLMRKVTALMPDLPIEVAWRFDSQLKGNGVEVINHGRSVRRLPDAEEELNVLGDAPLPRTSPYLEVILEDRSAVDLNDNLNDIGIGVTVSKPSDMDDFGAVAVEVPWSWVVDFAKHYVTLSVNNAEAARGWNVSADDLQEGDRVGLLVTPAGTTEIYINGELREHLTPETRDRIPSGVDLFPVLDLYGCTVQLSRTDADRPQRLLI